MKTVHKTTILIVLMLCIYFPLKAEETLKIAADNSFPPFSFLENGKPAGIDVDIIQELGKRIGVDFHISLIPWKRLLVMTEQGKFDGSMSLFKTNEREEFAIFTHPIHYSTFVLFVKKGNEFKFSSIKDLYGKNILKEAGFSIGDEFDQAVKEKKIKIREIFDPSDVFRLITNKRYDAFVNNLEVILYKLENQQDFIKYADEISYLPKPIKIKRGAFLVLSKKGKLKGKEAFAKKVTKNLINMENDGTYSKITDKHIKKN